MGKIQNISLQECRISSSLRVDKSANALTYSSDITDIRILFNIGVLMQKVSKPGTKYSNEVSLRQSSELRFTPFLMLLDTT